MSPSHIVPCTYGLLDVKHGINVRCEKMQPKISLQGNSVAENVTTDNNIESKEEAATATTTKRSKKKYINEVCSLCYPSILFVRLWLCGQAHTSEKTILHQKN